MRMRSVGFAVVAVGLLAGAGGEARGQVALPASMGSVGWELTYDPPQGAVMTTGGGWAAGGAWSAGGAPARVFPYSYYAAFPGPARVYVPLNANDAFPFGGNPYGHPYDRWTWSYLGGYPESLVRYYYPPVR